MSFRNTASFGKRQEYIAVGELLKRGFDVYMTLVDDQQIDCVIRLDGALPSYVDIQIKARSENAKNGATFANLNIKKPRKNFIYIFYSERLDKYWIIPSQQLVKMCAVSKSGKSKGNYKVDFAVRNKSGKLVERPKFREFENNFDTIKQSAL